MKLAVFCPFKGLELCLMTSGACLTANVVVIGSGGAARDLRRIGTARTLRKRTEDEPDRKRKTKDRDQT